MKKSAGCSCGSECTCKQSGTPCPKCDGKCQSFEKRLFENDGETLSLTPATQYMHPINEKSNNKMYGQLSKRQMRYS